MESSDYPHLDHPTAPATDLVTDAAANAADAPAVAPDTQVSTASPTSRTFPMMGVGVGAPRALPADHPQVRAAAAHDPERPFEK